MGGIVEVDGVKFRVDGDKIFITTPKLISQNQQREQWKGFRIRVQENKNNDPSLSKVAASWATIKEMYSEFSKNPASFTTTGLNNLVQNLATILRGLDSGTSTFFEDKVYRNLNRMSEASLTGKFRQEDYMDSLANKIFGNKKGVKGIQKLPQIKDKSGHSVYNTKSKKNKQYTGPQLMRIYALSKNPVQKMKLIKYGFSEEFFNPKNKNGIQAILQPDVVEFIDQVVDYLSNDYFESINNVYEYVNNVSLNRMENYFPTKTDNSILTTKEDTKDIIQGDYANVFSAQYASALKQRTNLDGEIVVEGLGFFNELDNHFEEMEKFKAYAEGVQEINTIMSSTPVRNSLKLMAQLEQVNLLLNISINPNSIQSLSQNNIIKLPFGITINMDKAFSNFALSALGFKAVQILKQGTSFITSYSDYNYQGASLANPLNAFMYAVDTASTYFNIVSNFKKAKQISGTFRERARGWDVYSLESGRGEIKRKGIGKILRMAGGLPTKIGDILGVMGYMTVYNRNIKNGMNPIEAAELFNDFNETQQTRRTQDLSPIQATQNYITRGVLMFASTGILQMNQYMQSYKNIWQKTGGKPWKASQKDFSKMIINASLANALFFTAGNFLKFNSDDEEDKEEFWDGFFKALSGMNMVQNAMPLTGNVIAYGYDVVMGNENPFASAAENINPFMEKLVKAFTTYSREAKNEKFALKKKVRIGQDVIEFLTGVNTKPFLAAFNVATKNTLFEESDYFKIFGFGTTSLPADWAGYKWSEISKGPRKGQVVKRKKTDRDIKKQKQEERFKGVSREERQRILIQEAKDRAKNR